MTEAQMLQLRIATSRVTTVIPMRHKEELKEARERLARLQGLCDHTNPDGSSAIQGSMFCNTCSICGWSDF